jgi:8-oxo-dGTP pyrophosphatase MutT (NUDIX family)
MTTLDDIQRILARHEPVLLDASPCSRAAVALILREGATGLEVLFIERAKHLGDPWSGDLGFPGGKVEAHDSDPRSAAERETMEELGLDLGAARYLGRLSDVIGATLPVLVSCFVYGDGTVGSLRPNGEVRDVFWVSLGELFNPLRHGEAPVRFRGEALARPAIHLPQPGKPVLWGLTYRLVMQFLQLLEGEHG